jgi:Secretion system C-terminal sorting domain
LSFEGNKVSNINYLKWQTTLEDNTDFFEIEKSIEGTKFDKIGVVKTHNNNSNEINEYSFNDPNASNKVNYYRLKIVDLDGSFEKSKIIAVDGNNAISYAKTYPNPISNTTILQIENESLVGTNAELLEMNGKLINKFTITGKKMSLELNKVPIGAYILKFSDGSFTKIIKN